MIHHLVLAFFFSWVPIFAFFFSFSLGIKLHLQKVVIFYELIEWLH